MKPALIVIFLLSLFSVKSEAKYYWPVRWDDHPVMHQVPAEFKKESAVLILDRRHIEYKDEGRNVFIYYTSHRIVKVLDDKGIESFNKFNIRTGGSRTIERIDARTILPNGKIIEMGPDKIKETKSDGGVKEHALAMEGVEKNAEVEVIYTERKPVSFFGTEIMQFGIAALTSDFTLVVPDRYTFEIKGYNGFPAPADTIIDTKHYYNSVATNVPAVDEEPYSDIVANLMRVDFRMSYMDEKPNLRQFTWDDMAKRLYSGFGEYGYKDRKVINRYLKSIGVEDEDNDLQKIKKIEDAIKTNITINDDIRDESSSYFNQIIEKKVATEQAYTKFFAACLLEAGVNFEVGMTSNHFNYPLDEKFENWQILEYYLFYFPSLKMYLYPASSFYRMPFIPQPALGNKGVFVRLTGYDRDRTAPHSIIHTISNLPADSSGSNIDATISFTADMTPEVTMTHSLRGYSAMGVREAFVYMPKDKEKEAVQGMMNIAARPEDISSYNLENVPFKNYYENRPINITASFQSPELLEKAGNKYLLKVGDVIGRQSEMYQEKERKLPIEIPYPHSLVRKIVINIPDGFTIVNPDAVKIRVEHKDTAGRLTMGFVSDYRLEGNKLTVDIRESYNDMHYPIAEIIPFKNVINAAADFNKVVLIMQKK